MNLYQNLNNKKLVFWGTGNICKSCLKYRSEVIPDFFIDSNPKGKLLDRDIISPLKVENWNQLFIVITTLYSKSIENQLKSFGLKKNQDFITFREFFDIKLDVLNSIGSIYSFVEQSSVITNTTVIFAPMFTGRRADQISSFFKKYLKEKFLKKIIIFTNLDGIPENKALEMFNVPVFNLPEIFRWDGTEDRFEYCNKSIIDYVYLLDEVEKNLVKNIENRKISFDYEKSLKLTKAMYAYLREIIKLIQPSEIIIWGEWFRSSYILQELAKKNKIKYGFMEWGWIPGTIQFDKGGIAGQGEYAVNPVLFNSRKNQYTNFDLIELIKKYVLKNQLDTGVFKIIPEDEIQLKKLDSTKKTVFLVGMGDIEMGMNPEDDYWKEYVSEIVSSTVDSYSLIREICKKNDLNFIYKPHPHARSKSEDEKYRSDESTIYITDMSIDRLINIADVVVSIASAVDYKVLMYEKPLVSLGKTGFNGKNCVYEVHNRNETEKTLLLVLEKGMTLEQKFNYNQYLQFLLENYLWDDLTHPDFKYGLTFDKDFFD